MILTETEVPHERQHLAGRCHRASQGAGARGVRSGVAEGLRSMAVKLAALALGCAALRALIALYWAVWWVTR